VALERGPLSLARITEELLGRNTSGYGLESLEQLTCGLIATDFVFSVLL
jgi:hypothetical protein